MWDSCSLNFQWNSDSLRDLFIQWQSIHFQQNKSKENHKLLCIQNQMLSHSLYKLYNIIYSLCILYICFIFLLNAKTFSKRLILNVQRKFFIFIHPILIHLVDDRQICDIRLSSLWFNVFKLFISFSFLSVFKNKKYFAFCLFSFTIATAMRIEI